MEILLGILVEQPDHQNDILVCVPCLRLSRNKLIQNLLDCCCWCFKIWYNHPITLGRNVQNQLAFCVATHAGAIMMRHIPTSQKPGQGTMQGLWRVCEEADQGDGDWEAHNECKRNKSTKWIGWIWSDATVIMIMLYLEEPSRTTTLSTATCSLHLNGQEPCQNEHIIKLVLYETGI